MAAPETRIPSRCGQPRRKPTKEQEDAILLTLLEVPAFRRKAGLPPRYGAGDTLELLGKILSCSRERIRQIEVRALRKLRIAAYTDPELKIALAHLIHK